MYIYWKASKLEIDSPKVAQKTKPQKPSNLDKEYWKILILLPWHWPSKPQFLPISINMVHIKCSTEGTFVSH